MIQVPFISGRNALRERGVRKFAMARTRKTTRASLLFEKIGHSIFLPKSTQSTPAFRASLMGQVPASEKNSPGAAPRATQCSVNPVRGTVMLHLGRNIASHATQTACVK